MAEEWMIYAILSTVFTGLQSFIIKLIAARGYSVNLVNSYALLVAAALGLITVTFFSGFGGNYLVGIAIASATGIVYMASTIARTRALRHLNDALVFSTYKSATVLFTALAGVLFFSESLMGLQMFGIALALVMPFFIETARKDDEIGVFRKGMFLLLIAVVAGSISAVLNKIGAPLFESALMFGVFNYLFGMATGFSLQAFEHRLCMDHWFLDRRKRARNTAFVAVTLGIMIFFAFSTLMLAFRTGSLSLVYTINSVYFVIPIILSTLFLKEKRGWKDGAVVLVSLLAVVLLVS